MTLSPVLAWQLAASGFLLAWAGLLAVGWSQRQEAASPWWRLVWVTGCLALMGAAPLAVCAVCIHLGLSTPEQLAVAPFMALLGTAFLLICVGPPVRLRGTRRKLPRVVDPQFLARLAELAQRIGAPVPLVRLWPSVTGSQQMLAFAGTLQAPQLVVTDGILQRLSPAECDAIVAHELAHIANGSLWLLFGLFPLVSCVTTGMWPFFPWTFACAFGAALIAGLRRLTSRPIELDCDLRAARAIGFPETARALAKIHAVHVVGNKGLLSLLVYATATHPSRDMRLLALHTAAPAADQPHIAIDPVAVRRHRLASRAAALIWLAVMVGSLVVERLGTGRFWPAAILTLTAISPSLLITLAFQRQVALTRGRLGQRRGWRLIVAVTLGLVIALYAIALQHQTHALQRNPPAFADRQAYVVVAASLVILLALLAFALISIVWLIWTRNVRKLRWKVLVALQVHDFQGALDLGLANPKLVARDKLLRYNIALARAVCGDRQNAIADLEQLWRDKPNFPLAAILLNVLLLDTDQAQRALDVALEVAPRLKRDVATHMMEARALRRLDRADEARSACERGLAIRPEDPTLIGFSAALALDRSDLPEAQRLIERALELGPAESYLLVVQAEIAVQARPVAEAQTIVTENLLRVRTNPLVFLQYDVERIEQALSAKAAAESAPVVT